MRFPSPDAVVGGQLVYVTFTVRGTINKPVDAKPRRADGKQWLYGFKPTLRSVFILSKTGPMVSRLAVRRRYGLTIARQ